MQNTHDAKREPDVVAQMRPKALPFEYEDRSDGSYDRAIEEVKAAWLWTQGRRARGLLPS